MCVVDEMSKSGSVEKVGSVDGGGRWFPDLDEEVGMLAAGGRARPVYSATNFRIRKNMRPYPALHIAPFGPRVSALLPAFCPCPWCCMYVCLSPSALSVQSSLHLQYTYRTTHPPTYYCVLPHTLPLHCCMSIHDAGTLGHEPTLSRRPCARRPRACSVPCVVRWGDALQPRAPVGPFFPIPFPTCLPTHLHTVPADG